MVSWIRASLISLGCRIYEDNYTKNGLFKLSEGFSDGLSGSSNASFILVF
jgi:hypothetical protein